MVLPKSQATQASSARLNVPSSKNASGRCTRTIKATPESTMCPVRMLAEWHDFLASKGTSPDGTGGGPPSIDTPVFVLPDGLAIERVTVHEAVQSVLTKVGVPRDMAGSHSLRRGGASLYRAARIPDEHIKDFGRWLSDAFKLYIHMDAEVMDAGMQAATTLVPKFELN